MASRRLSLRLHTLRAVQHCPLARLRISVGPRLRRWWPARSIARALADHPSPWPVPDEVREFEHDLAKTCEELRQLRDEVPPAGRRCQSAPPRGGDSSPYLW